MYKVTKFTGMRSTVIVENTDTKANVNIGQVSITIVNILEKNGYGSDFKNMACEWNFEINKETATQLAMMSMTMNKPIRDQRKKPVGKIGVEVDAFDLIYGIGGNI